MELARARDGLVHRLSLEISDTRVLAAMGKVPRELFIPPEARMHAYEDRPLPIGLDQTISQPFIVALMTASLGLTGTEKVLEVGTGSGYQAAILGELARKVISVERFLALADEAKRLLAALEYRNITVHLASDILGWPDDSPYDAIIVTAGSPEIPNDLVAQLAIGGRMIIPVGSRYLQQLCLVTRAIGQTTVEQLCGCHFVPLIGKGAWEQDN